MRVNALQVLAEPRRQRILQAIWGVELCASDIHARAGRVTFGAVSQHLSRLEQCGFVICRRQGRQRFYRAVPQALGDLRAHFESMWGEKLSDLRRLAEAQPDAPTERHS
jgi:DNA-binding transcriptional ArsR family regulator